MEHEHRARDEARAAAAGLAQGLGDTLWGVVLFGSGARGDAIAESDLDLLVVVDALPDRFSDRRRLLRQALPRHLRGRASLVVRTRAEFEGAFPSLYLDVGLDGVILYDRDSYMHHQVERIRALAGEAGLTRSRTRGGFSWRWADPPTGHWRVDWDGVHGLRT